MPTPVRILHTSDWHLGHQLHDCDRAAEHEAFLTWLLDTAEQHNVDALLITGDIFDHSQPPASAQQMWYQFLVRAHARLPRAQVIAIAGNHDSPLRLSVAHAFERALGRLHVMGSLADAQRMHAGLPAGLIPLDSADGSQRAWVLAVPFLRGAEVGIDDVQTQVRQIYADVLQQATPFVGPHDALLLTGHAYVVGGQLSELSERMLSRGHQGAWPVQVFADIAQPNPLQVQGVALGHLHRPQELIAQRVWYAGSPLPLSLDEESYAHRALLVELNGKAAPVLHNLPIPRLVPLLRLPNARDFAPLPEILALLRALPLKTEADPSPIPLCEVRILLDGPQPDLAVQLQAACEGRRVKIVKISKAQTAQSAGNRLQRELHAWQPLTLARGFFAGMPEDGTDPPPLTDELEGALTQLVTWAQMEPAEVDAERSARVLQLAEGTRLAIGKGVSP